MIHCPLKQLEWRMATRIVTVITIPEDNENTKQYSEYSRVDELKNNVNKERTQVRQSGQGAERGMQKLAKDSSLESSGKTIYKQNGSYSCY